MLRGEEGEASINHFSDEHVDPNLGEPLRRRTPLGVETDRIGRPMTEAERGAVGLSDTTGSYISPDAHRGRCQICGRRPGSRVWCAYCRRGVSPGCCLLCEFPRTDRRRRGWCILCLPTGGWDAGVPIPNTGPATTATFTAAGVTQNNLVNSRICRALHKLQSNLCVSRVLFMYC